MPTSAGRKKDYGRASPGMSGKRVSGSAGISTTSWRPRYWRRYGSFPSRRASARPPPGWRRGAATGMVCGASAPETAAAPATCYTWAGNAPCLPRMSFCRSGFLAAASDLGKLAGEGDRGAGRETSRAMSRGPLPGYVAGRLHLQRPDDVPHRDVALRAIRDTSTAHIFPPRGEIFPAIREYCPPGIKMRGVDAAHGPPGRSGAKGRAPLGAPLRSPFRQYLRPLPCGRA